MAILYVLSALLLGAALVRRIPIALYPFEQAALAVVLGLFSWTWLAFLAALVAPYDVALPIVVTLCAVVTAVLWRSGHAERRPLEGGLRAWTAWGVGTAVTTVVMARLFWTHSLLKDAEGIWSAGATWADFGLHASFVTHVAAATSLPSDLPIASGERMTYPFLIDLLSGLYMQGGMSLHASLFWPGVLLAVAVCQLLIAVGLRLFGRISVGLGGLGLALTIGSAAGVWVAWGDWRESGKGLFAFLGALPADYSQDADNNAHVTNLLVDGLIPQRAILFGLGVGLIVLLLLHASRERQDHRLLWPAAVLVGLLPMAHPHSFMFGVALFGGLAAEAAWRKRSIPWAIVAPLGVGLLLALPQIVWQQSANGRGTGGRLRFAWMWELGQSLPAYWWANFGLFGLALLAIPFVLRRHRQLIWFLPMLGLLAVTQVYAFQPFEYDNLKLIWWVYIVGGFFVAYVISEIVRRERAWLVLIVPLVIAVVTPGVLAITREFQLRDQFSSRSDIALAEWVQKNTPADAVFVGTDRPGMPVAALAGRSVVLGYRGWLFNFAIPYGEREAAVRAAVTGRFEDPALRRFGADYAVIGTTEDPSWSVDETALQQRTVMWSNDLWRVYKLS